MLKDKTVVLGVTGSIAAYKMANVASMLVKQHCDVHVIMTENATKFIHPITFETLTNHKCLVETFDRNFQFHVAHVSLAQKADCILIAPASANVIGKLANGIADDMLTTTVMAAPASCPKMIAPAMNTNMFVNPVVQNNIKKLAGYGYEIIQPAAGRLACGDVGAGKLPDEQTLVDHIFRAIAKESAGDCRTDQRGIGSSALFKQPFFRKNGICHCQNGYAPRCRRDTGKRPGQYSGTSICQGGSGGKRRGHVSGGKGSSR
jgi:phosphopantothenoylcysteine decarboxylase/phosphopantothenate--cysteine ligase